MNNRMKGYGLLLAMLVLPAIASAEVVSVNFANANPALVDTNVFTGVVQDLTWSECYVSGAGTFNFPDRDGSTLDVQVTAAGLAGSDNAWVNWANKNGAGADSETNASVVMSEIPFENYYIIAYVGGWSPSSACKMALTIGTETKYVDFLGVNTVPSLQESTDINPGDGYDGGSYVVFGSEANPLSGSSQTLTGTWTQGRPQIGGIQIVQVDEPLIDGIPTAWIIGYFGSTEGFSGSADSDSDGFSNLEEYLADTDPTDSDSLLKMLDVSLDFTNVVISYQNGGSNANVIVEYRADAGPDWETLATNVAPASVTNTYIHATTGSGGWYRTKAERP